MKSKINIPKSFFSFLIASFFIWLLINLSKEYITSLSYEIVYEKLPQNKVFQEEPLKNIDLLVKASGFKLLLANFSEKKILFDLTNIRSKSNNKYYIVSKKQEEKIQEQLYRGLVLNKVLQDTVFLQLGSLATKKVKLVKNINVNYKHGYDLVSPIKIIPDSVLISGPKLQLEKINSLTTELYELNDISKNKRGKVKIKRPEGYNKLKLGVSEAEIEIIVDKFTEGEFLVPFVVENLPAETNINTFPKKVKIVFKVGLSSFNEISSNSFKVVCDYRITKENDLPYLIPKLQIKPNIVSSVRLFPKKIEFLIQK